MRRLIALCFFLCLLAFIRPAAASVGALEVFVSIPPQAAFVEGVAGDLATVHVLVGSGQSPHTFEPTPKQLADLSRAQLYFAIGLPFEVRLLKKARGANPKLVVVPTQQGVSYRLMRVHAPGHDHDALQPEVPNETGHVHGQGPRGPRPMPDPHIWLDPKLVKFQVHAIAEALAQADPAHAAQYRKNRDALDAKLDRLDRTIRKQLAPYHGRSLYVFHPAFGYFARAFGLVQVPIEQEGKEPGGSELAMLIAGAKRHGAKTIFVEPQFSKRQADAIAAAISGRVETLDPLARDYFANLESMARKIAAALSQERR